jgi:hypothetical protein
MRPRRKLSLKNVYAADRSHGGLMTFPREYYDARTLDLMSRALESAWHDVEHLIHGRDLDFTWRCAL